jgi:hypothetical protein
MGDTEELDVLRVKYERALARYEAACADLNRHLRAGTHPSEEEMQRERDARSVLDLARREYLAAWKQQ